MDTLRPQKGEYQSDISCGVRGSPWHSCQSRGEASAHLLPGPREEPETEQELSTLHL